MLLTFVVIDIFLMKRFFSHLFLLKMVVKSQKRIFIKEFCGAYQPDVNKKSLKIPTRLYVRQANVCRR